jgi:hypothetical protein
MILKVIEIFKIKNRGSVVIIDPKLPLDLKIKLGHAVKRISDNQEWTIAGIERWSDNRLIDTILLKGDAEVLIGDVLEIT